MRKVTANTNIDLKADDIKAPIPKVFKQNPNIIRSLSNLKPNQMLPALMMADALQVGIDFGITPKQLKIAIQTLSGMEPSELKILIKKVQNTK